MIKKTTFSNKNITNRLIIGIVLIIAINLILITISGNLQYFKKQNGLITFILDDGTPNQLEEIYPLFAKRNMTASWAIIISRTENMQSYPKYAQIDEVYNNTPGWEIVSHTVSHPRLSDLNYEELNVELKNSKAKLKKYSVNALVYPYYDFNAETIEVAKKIYDVAFAGSLNENYEPKNNSGSDNLENINYTDYINYEDNKYKLKRVTITAGGSNPIARGTLNEWINLVNTAEKNNGWLIFCLHDVNQESKVMLEQLLDYIQNKKIEVGTIKKGIDKFVD